MYKSLTPFTNILKKDFVFISIGTWLLFLCFGFIFFKYFGTLMTGVRLYDDHEIFQIVRDLNDFGFFYTLKKFLVFDYDIYVRFRPAYIFFRTLECWILGNNLVYWNYFYYIISTIISLLCYQSIIALGFNKIETSLFYCMTFFGSFSSIFWRRAPAENPGILFFWLAFFLITLTSAKKKEDLIIKIVILFCIAIQALIKENFIFMIPVLLFLKLFLDLYYNEFDIIKTAKNNFYLIIISVMIFALSILFIKFIFLNNTEGYSKNYGIEATLIIKVFINLISNYYFPYYILISTIYLFLLFKKERSNFFRNKNIYLFLLMIIISFLITIPQILIYSKSGMTERYLVPAVYGPAFIIIAILKLLRSDFHNFFSGYFLISKVFYLITIFLSIFIAIHHLYEATKAANSYKYEGLNLDSKFEKIKKLTKQDDIILIMGSPELDYEYLLTTQLYLRDVLGRKNIYTYNIENLRIPYSSLSKFEIILRQDYLKRFSNPLQIENTSKSLKSNLGIVIYFGSNEQFPEFGKNLFHNNHYSSDISFPFNLYY